MDRSQVADLADRINKLWPHFFRSPERIREWVATESRYLAPYDYQLCMELLPEFLNSGDGYFNEAKLFAALRSTPQYKPFDEAAWTAADEINVNAIREQIYADCLRIGKELPDDWYEETRFIVRVTGKNPAIEERADVCAWLNKHVDALRDRMRSRGSVREANGWPAKWWNSEQVGEAIRVAVERGRLAEAGNTVSVSSNETMAFRLRLAETMGRIRNRRRSVATRTTPATEGIPEGCGEDERGDDIRLESSAGNW